MSGGAAHGRGCRGSKELRSLELEVPKPWDGVGEGHGGLNGQGAVCAAGFKVWALKQSLRTGSCLQDGWIALQAQVVRGLRSLLTLLPTCCQDRSLGGHWQAPARPTVI